MHNTGNPLGSTQILDLYDNSESIDNYANSQEDFFPDRFGTKRLTLAGLIKRSMALRNEINDFSGALTFKPEWSDVPMNVSEGVGGEGGGLNLQAEALGNRSELLKNAVIFITPEMLGAPCDGVSDDTIFVEEAIKHGSMKKIPVVLNGDYLLKKTIKLTLAHVDITGSGTITHEDGGLELTGVVGEEINLITEINDFSAITIDVMETTGFEIGDIGIVHSSIMCLSEDALSMQLGTPTGSGGPSWFGEFFQVSGKTNQQLSLATPLVFNRYPVTSFPESGTRQRSTVKKITPLTGSISGRIKFIRKGLGTAVNIAYGRGFKISGDFDARTLPGASVIFKYSLDSEVLDSTFKLNPEVKMKYGTVNPDSYNYYQFNSVKCISSQGCGASNCNFENPSQTFDITYLDMPSTMCYMKACVVLFAKHNMGTSHGGSFGSLFSGNTGISCWRGITCRSREDSVIGNRIFGFRKNPKSPHTNSDTTGITFTEGFTVGAVAINNIVSGFYSNFYINNYSSRGNGFDYLRVTISGNQSTYCYNHVWCYTAVPVSKDTESGLVISNNIFSSHTSEGVLLSDYTRAPIIKSNIFVDSPVRTAYQIKTGMNCVGVEITNNSFKDSDNTVWINAITDPELGTGGIDSAKISCFGNTVRGNEQSDSFAFGNTKASIGNNFQAHNLGYKYLAISDVTDYTLDSQTYSVLYMSPQTAGFNLVGITGGINGRELTLFNGSNTRVITIKNSDTVQTKSGSDIPMTLRNPVRFVFLLGKWREI